MRQVITFSNIARARLRGIEVAHVGLVECQDEAANHRAQKLPQRLHGRQQGNKKALVPLRKRKREKREEREWLIGYSFFFILFLLHFFLFIFLLF
jgi:hypothetical protein